jgi:hypothetical protein
MQMPLSLHEAIVPNWLQLLEATARLLDKAESWAAEQGIGEAELLGTRLAPDMLPLAYQFKSCWVHSSHAIQRCREGVFSPHLQDPPLTWAGLRDGLGDAIAALKALDPAELEAMAGNDMAFQFGENRLPFTVQDFLLSFSNPNVFFHAATAYDILRMKGMPIGKRDFMGRLRMKSSE